MDIEIDLYDDKPRLYVATAEGDETALLEDIVREALSVGFVPFERTEMEEIEAPKALRRAANEFRRLAEMLDIEAARYAA